MKKYALIGGMALLYTGFCTAASISVPVFSTDTHKPQGMVTFTEHPSGLLITPALTGLPPGLHGFHLHQHPDCGDMGNHAGGHFDPGKTNSHLGPYATGHLGDLPALYVDASGKAQLPTLAPRLHLSDLKGLTVMIHADGDNYSNNPPLGGGGPRIACGVVGDGRS